MRSWSKSEDRQRRSSEYSWTQPLTPRAMSDRTGRVLSHRGFWPARISSIAANTLTELTRQKVFCGLLIFALVLIGGSVFLARFSFQQEFQILKDISLGAMSI